MSSIVLIWNNCSLEIFVVQLRDTPARRQLNQLEVMVMCCSCSFTGLTMEFTVQGLEEDDCSWLAASFRIKVKANEQADRSIAGPGRKSDVVQEVHLWRSKDATNKCKDV